MLFFMTFLGLLLNFYFEYLFSNLTVQAKEIRRQKLEIMVILIVVLNELRLFLLIYS